MTTMEKVCELIMKARKNKVSRDQLKPDALLAEDLGFDSLGMTELLVLAEDAFSLEIPVEDALKAADPRGGVPVHRRASGGVEVINRNNGC